jgi:hypothetical protein
MLLALKPKKILIGRIYKNNYEVYTLSRNNMSLFIEAINDSFNEIKSTIKKTNTSTIFWICIFIIIVQLLLEYQREIYDTPLKNIMRNFAVLFLDIGVFRFVYGFYEYIVNEISFSKRYNNEISYEINEKLYNQIENELREKKEILVIKFAFYTFNFLMLVYIIMSDYYYLFR